MLPMLCVLPNRHVHDILLDTGLLYNHLIPPDMALRIFVMLLVWRDHEILLLSQSCCQQAEVTSAAAVMLPLHSIEQS